MKKLFTFLLALIASVGIASAQSGTCGDNLTWELNAETGILTISGTGVMADYTYYTMPWYKYRSSIQSVIITDGVTSIGDYAFYQCSSLPSITIPNSVTSIGFSAFEDCTSLTSVTIPNSVTSIGKEAFYYCSSLTSVTIPNSVTSIGEGAFNGCSSVTSVIIGNSVTSIGDYAFYYCSSLTSVTIPNSVTSIGWSAFGGCSSLTSPVYNAHCFAYMPKSYSGAYVIPKGIKQIAGGAFEDCSSLTSVTIGNSVTSIGDRAFYNCSSLTSVTIPNSVTSIGDDAFVSCFSLTSINVDSNNPNYSSVDGVLFSKDKTTLIRCPERKRGAYTIPNSVTSIGDNAFHWCDALTSITIPNSVTSIGHDAFWYCSSLTSVTIPNSVTSIGDNVFVLCSSLTSVTIGNSVTSIGYAAFSDCSSLTSVTIPNSVTSIGEEAFFYCESLTSVTIPNSVTSIGKYAFEGCSSLTSVTIPNSVTSIGSYAFSRCSSLTSVTIPNSVTSIECFSYCSSLTSVTIGNGVTSIGHHAFYNCSSLTSVTIPNGVTSIGVQAFYGCSSLTSVTFEGSTPPSIDRDVFYNTNNCPIYVPCGTKEAYVTALNVNNTIDESRVIEKLPYTYSVLTSDSTLGSVTITQEPTCTEPVIFRADATEGYQFTQWSDGNTDNPRSLILTQDTILKALFEQIVIEQDTIGAPSVKPVTSTEGYDFYVAFMPNGASKPTDKDLKLQLFVNSREANRVRLEYADGSTKDYNVPAGGTTTIDVDPKKAYWDSDKGEEEKILDKGVRVYSLDKKPMTVYSGNQNGESDWTSSFDGAHVLPKEALGQEYVIQSANDDNIATEFVVMSTRPGKTNVKLSLTTNSRLANRQELVISFTKSKQIYIVRSQPPTTDEGSEETMMDLSGSTIWADAPVAVWSGNQSAIIPNQAGMTADHTYDQLLPINKWQNEFVVPLTGLLTSWNEVHIISSEDDNKVDIYGNKNKTTPMSKTLNSREKWVREVKGQVLGNVLDSTLYIKAAKPIQVYLYSTSGVVNLAVTPDGREVRQGNPAMTMISPLAYMTDTMVFPIFEVGDKTMEHQATIWAKKSTVSSIQLDGVSISAQFKDVPTVSGYSLARVNLTPGAHTLTAAEKGFGGYILGMSEGQAYMYPIGYTFNPYQDTIIVADSTGISDIIPDGQDTIPYVEVQPDGEITIDITDVRIGVITIVTIGTESGQVHPGFGGNYDELENTRVVMEYVLNPFGQTASPDKWYAFAVPFEVDIENGITRKYGNKSHVPGKDFMILEYDSELRSKTGKGWVEKKSGSLTPGHIYMLGIEGNCNRWLFEKVRDADVLGDKKKDLQHYAHGNSKNNGWQGLGNTTLEYVDMSFSIDDILYILVYDNQHSRYITYNIDELVLAVGQPFFVQTTQEGASVVFEHNNGKGKGNGNGKKNMPIYAPSYDVQPIKPRVRFTIEKETIHAIADRLYITLHDDNLCGSYIIGRDLMRMDGGSKQVPNFWCPMADGTQLSAHGVSMPTTYTMIPLGIYAPVKGEYILNAHMHDMDDYLVEIYHNNVCVGTFMHDMPLTLDLTAGTTNDYSIRISRKVSTDLNPAVDTQQDKDNTWFDILGRKAQLNEQGVFVRRGEKIVNY